MQPRPRKSVFSTKHPKLVPQPAMISDPLTGKVVPNPNVGKPIPNPRNRAVYPYWLMLDQINGSTSAVIAANSSVERSFSNNLAGVLELQALIGNATSTNYTVKFIDNGSQRVWSQNNIHGETIVGTRTFPYYLPQKFYLLPGESINVLIQDLSGAQNTVDLCFLCQKKELPELQFGARWQDTLKIRKPFFYTTNDSPIICAANSSATSAFTISTESHFWLKQITQRSTSTYTVKILQNRTEKGLQPNPIKNVIFAGNSQNYFAYDDGEEVFIEQNTYMEVQVTDTSGAENRIFITFGGINIYEYFG